VDRSLHQRIAWGRTTRVPLREMTIERHCHVGTLQPVRGAAIATNRQREAANVSLLIDWLSLYQS